MNKIRLGIVGLGNMGSGHCKTLLEGKVPELELAAVADVKESKRIWAKESSVRLPFLRSQPRSC